MDRRPLAAVALTALVVCAGCSSILPGGGENVARDRYDVPETTTGTPANPSTVAPGVERTSLTDPYELATAHALALEPRPFVFVRVETVSAPNGTVLRQTRLEGHVAANRTRFSLSSGHWRLDRQWVFDRYWSSGDGSPVYYAHEGADATDYVAYSDDDTDPLGVRDVLGRDVTFRNRLFRIASSVDETTVTPTTGTGPKSYVISGNADTDQWLASNVATGSVKNVSLTLEVDHTGLVGRVFLTYVLSLPTRTLEFEERYRFTPADDTPVTAPRWRETVPASVERRSVDKPRDSVGGPMVSCEGSAWNDDGSPGNVSDPYPDRSVTGDISDDRPAG